MITSIDQLVELLNYYEPGEEIDVTVSSQEGNEYKEKTVTVTLGEDTSDKDDKKDSKDSDSRSDNSDSKDDSKDSSEDDSNEDDNSENLLDDWESAFR